MASKAKEMEINIQDSAINKADIPGATKKQGSDSTAKKHDGKGSSSRRRRGGKFSEKKVLGKGGPNDVSVYKRIPGLLPDISKISFFDPLGMEPELKTITESDITLYQRPRAIPGIIAYQWSPTIGKASNYSDAVNVVATNNFAQLRRGLSGYSAYDAPDFMFYELAMGSCYACYEHMVRIYGACNIAKAENRYIPDALLRALGVDPTSDWKRTLADYKAFLDTYAVSLASMNVPQGIGLHDRWTWMCRGIYKDSQSLKAQIYLFKPYEFLKFAFPNQPGGKPSLQYVKTPKAGTLLQWMTLAQELLQPIVADADFNRMSGDCLKVFGASKLRKTSLAADGYVLVPEYNLEVLSQFQNASLFTKSFLYKGSLVLSTITQNPEFNNEIVQTVRLQLSSNYSRTGDILAANDTYGSFYKYLSLYKDDVSGDDIMVATRLMVHADFSKNVSPDSENKEYLLDMYGTELITNCYIYYYSFLEDSANPMRRNRQIDSQPIGSIVFIIINESAGTESYNNVASLTDQAVLLSAFDYHPAINYYLHHSGVAEITHTGALFDYNNYTSFAKTDLNKYHITAVMSLLVLPESEMTK